MWKLLGNFRNLINQNNNDIHIDPKPRAEICGNFWKSLGNYLEISRKFLEISI